MSFPFQIIYSQDGHKKIVSIHFLKYQIEDEYDVAIINNMGEVQLRLKLSGNDQRIDISHLSEEDLHIKVHTPYITVVKHLQACMEER